MAAAADDGVRPVEVSGRPVHAPRGLTAALGERARALAWPVLALSAALAASVTIVAAQPVRSAWWTYADADATYTASGLNLLLGEPVRYLDHPGLPLQQLIAVAFGVDEVVGRVTGEVDSARQHVDRLMLDLDRTRPVYRGFAILFYLAGAVLSCFLFARFFGHWGWGLAGGLLWVAAPGLAPMSIQYRPDVVLSVLVLVVAFLIGRAVETRSPLLFGAAAAALGFTLMVKLHAAGLLAALALAAVWRRPADGWPRDVWTQVTGFARRRRRWLAAGGLAWLTLAAALNARHLPFTPTLEQVVALLAPLLLVGDYLGLALLARRRRLPRWLHRVLDPFYGYVGLALLAGLVIPITLDVRDGLQALVSLENTLLGRGINQEVAAFSAPLDQLLNSPLREALLVFVVAGIAALVGLARREPLPVVWFAGAVALGVMAQARLAATHYFAPAFMVSLLGAFWLLARGRRSGVAFAGPIAVALLVVYAVVPQLENRRAVPFDPQLAEVTSRTFRLLEQRLRPGEVAITPIYWPHPDTRYFDVVQGYVTYSPAYPYRFLSESYRSLDFARDRRLRFRYYTSPAVRNLTGTRQLGIATLGTYTVRPLTDVPDTVELVAGPGTEP
jgi:hypothetical protein